METIAFQIKVLNEMSNNTLVRAQRINIGMMIATAVIMADTQNARMRQPGESQLSQCPIVDEAREIIRLEGQNIE